MNDLSFLTEYSIPVIVGICLCIGFVIKNFIPTDKVNQFIPLIVEIIGLGVSIWLNKAITPAVVLQGLYSGLISTGAYELLRNMIKQFTKNKEE